MKYELVLIDLPGYLHARVTGDHTAQNVKRYLLEVHEACVQRGHDAVLLEMNLVGPSLAVGEIFDVISRGSAAGRQLRRIGYVSGNTVGASQRPKFAETVANNRGVNVRLFDDLEAAHAWMRSP